ncbi:DNA adenine methylase [Streptococcus canis]|uniref:DNA adenine methylase n=1 Tax=Streptococcus canis TaxID=1329 RepID=UPI000C1C110A|nr:DNA adenine methylase [Streptococcus canis]GAY71418.1 methyltransferase [Streptococcus canis]GAY71784.1 methyltransferase [Streptococcus canis]
MKSLLRYPGSKWNLAKKIVARLPEHKSYLEPYFGSGAVLFNKPVRPIETLNDLNEDVVNLFRVIQSESEALREKLLFTPYSRKLYDQAWQVYPDSPVDKALQFIIKSRMSHGFRVTEKSGWKRDVVGRERAYTTKQWNDLPDIVKEMALRLKQVQIESRPALELIKEFNYSDVCMYIDPPYVLSTRSRKQYSHEMTDHDHTELLDVLKESKANILLSGYDSQLYNDQLRSWERLEFAATAEHGLPRTEVLWTNFSPNKQLILDLEVI